ncbi:hypothetical protein V8E36_005690 [Tilletia maclaganii]
MVGSFAYTSTLPDVPSWATTSPDALYRYLEPFTSHTGPKAFSILAWLYVGVHFFFLLFVLLVIGMLIKTGRFWLFRTVNGRHGVVLVHNVVDVPLCLIVIFFIYDAAFWIISLLGYQNDFAQHNWQVLHWLRYIMLSAIGFNFMTGVAAVWPFSPATMRYPWMWNLVMVGFLPCAVLATIPPMLQANAAWNQAWDTFKMMHKELMQLPQDALVPESIVEEARYFLSYCSKYAYKHAIVAIILVLFCLLAALVFSVIGFRVARIVWQDVQDRRVRNRREVRMARRWSRPSLNYTDSATTSKGFASVGSADWTSQHDAEAPRIGADRSEEHSSEKLADIEQPARREPGNLGKPAAPRRPQSQQPVSENSQRELRNHFNRTLILFVTMWCMIASLVGGGLYFTICIYPATRNATPDAVYGNSALKVLCIFHIVEFANITLFGQVFIGTLVLHRVVALRRRETPSPPPFKERNIRIVPDAPVRPPHEYTFAVGQQVVRITKQEDEGGDASVPPHRTPLLPSASTFEVPQSPTLYGGSPALTPKQVHSAQL